MSSSPVITPSVVVATQDELLDMIEEVFPDHWVQPMKDPGPGWDALQALAKIMERASQAVETVDRGLYMLLAQEGGNATGQVEFYRSSNAAGAVTVLAGTTVYSKDPKRFYETTEDAVFGAGDFGPIVVAAKSEMYGWQYNQKGPQVAADGTVLVGPIKYTKRMYQNPQYGDPTILVRQTTDFEGGAHAMLEALGHDRGIDRLDGELIEDYRERIRRLPDTVSPAAVRRTVEAWFSSRNLPADSWSYIETWDPTYQSCFDAPSETTNPSYDPSVFVLDDPRPSPPFRNRYLSESDHRGAFIVVVPNLPAMRHTGLVFDDPGTAAADFLTSIGRRAHSALDVPAGSTSYLQGCLDGDDLEKNATYKGLYDLLQSIKAAGVNASIEREDQ